MQVLTRIECPSCGGNGPIYTGYTSCDICGNRYQSDIITKLITQGRQVMPCGHHKRSMRKNANICSACNGTGQQELWLDLEELVNQVISGWVTATGTPLKRIG